MPVTEPATRTVPRQVYLFLALGLVAASQSGNLIRLGDAHPVAIAAWRLLIATMLLAPLAGRDLLLLAKLTRRERWLYLAAGASLAAHFVAWIAAVQLTSVANAAIVFAINPIITALAGRHFFGERLNRGFVLSMTLGLAGVAVIGAGDLSLSPEHLPGDLAALVCSVLFTTYFLLGKRLREVLPTGAYVTGLYGIAALICFAALLLLGLPLVGYSSRTWLCFGLMALVPTMIGHTSMNNALRWLPAGRIATATLAEPFLAGVVAWFAWKEPITPGLLAGYALVALSVVFLVRDARTPTTRRGVLDTPGSAG